MKISRQAQREAKQLFHACKAEGNLSDDKVRETVKLLTEKKPRDYVAVLSHLNRLVKLDVQRRTAHVQSAVALNDSQQNQLKENLAKLFGKNLIYSFTENADLLGGMRVKVGSDVYDGSVRTRLAKLEESFLNQFNLRKMSNLLQEIEAQIAGAKTEVAKENVGIVRETGDGVAKIEGLTGAMMNEMLDFGNGVTGLALNLEETEVGAIVLGDFTGISEGQEVKATGKLLQVPVGKGLLGRVTNALGQAIDGKGDIQSDTTYPVEKIAPGIVKRKSVDQPLQTGILAIDAMIPIGRGQRELIIGDRSTGKTTIGIDAIINQSRMNKAAEAAGDKDYRPVYSIYVAVGQKRSNVAQVISVLEEAGALEHTIVVAATASDSATNQYLAPFAGAAMGEWFMDNGMDALIVYDDLSKHAVAYRQVSLVLKRPSGREAYPGDVFYLHSRLLERSARVGKDYGNGSLTALPIIETQAGDVSAYIPTNVISITDGQIFLEGDLFYQGVRPAVSVGLSVSRVGSAAQIKAMKQVAGTVKLDLAQFRELAAFAQFGSDLDEKTQQQLDRGKRIVEVFKQNQYNPLSVPTQVVTLWAVQNGKFDDVKVEQVGDFKNQLREYLETRKKDLLRKIETEGKLGDELEAEVSDTIDAFKKTF